MGNPNSKSCQSDAIDDNDARKETHLLKSSPRLEGAHRGILIKRLRLSGKGLDYSRLLNIISSSLALERAEVCTSNDVFAVQPVGFCGHYVCNVRAA
ncbi:hypothetical protein D3C71_1775700 [compost metagenome]